MIEDSKIKEALAVLAAAEAEGQEGLRNVMILNKNIPKGWNPAANAPYYKERWAREAKLHLDKIIADHNVVVRVIPKYCKMVTQYQRLIQGQLYLLHHLDPEGVYAAARPHIEISRQKTEIHIHWGASTSETLSIKTTTEELEKANVYEQVTQSGWRNELEHWIETSQDNDRFIRDNISISDAEQDDIRASLMSIENLHIKRLGKRCIEIINKDLNKL